MCQFDACIGRAVRILHEKALGEASSWAPYIMALPTDLSDSPVHWSPEEVSTLLQGLLMAEDTLALMNSIESSFCLLDSICFKVRFALCEMELKKV